MKPRAAYTCKTLFPAVTAAAAGPPVSSPQMLDDIERAVDDGVNSYKLLGRDARAVPAGGATEIEIAHQLQQWGRKVGRCLGWAAGTRSRRLEQEAWIETHMIVGSWAG